MDFSAYGSMGCYEIDRYHDTYVYTILAEWTHACQKRIDFITKNLKNHGHDSCNIFLFYSLHRFSYDFNRSTTILG